MSLSKRESDTVKNGMPQILPAPSDTASNACVLVWGAGGHSRVIVDIVLSVGHFEIAGFIDDVNPGRRGTEFCGKKVIGGVEQLPLLFTAGIRKLVIGIGDCSARLNAALVAKSAGFELMTLCHPSSVVSSSAVIGSGSVLAAASVVSPGALIGSNVIINTSASVDHDCIVEDGVHISPGVHTGGHCRIGRGAWIGIGAVVKDRISIGAGSIIGAGAVVVEDIPEGVIAYGVPARVVRKR